MYGGEREGGKEILETVCQLRRDDAVEWWTMQLRLETLEMIYDER